MTPRRGSAPALLAAAGLLLVASCSSSKPKIVALDETVADWQARVDETIPDAPRAARLKQLGQDLVALQRSIHREVEALGAQAAALNARYDATDEDERSLALAFDEQRERSFARYRDLVFAMRREVTAAEWKTLTR